MYITAAPLYIRVYSGADVMNDHHLVKAKINMKLKRQKKKGNEKPRPFDFGKLKSAEVRDENENELTKLLQQPNIKSMRE